MKLLLGTLAVAAAVVESRVPGRPLWVRGGSTMSSSGSADYDLQCELVLRDVVAAAQTQINQYAEEIDSGSCGNPRPTLHCGRCGTLPPFMTLSYSIIFPFLSGGLW